MAYKARPIEERFWPKVTKGKDCWLWNAYRTPTGYGQVYFQNRYESVHVVSWMIARGDIPKGMLVLHKCDVRLCVNPDHLYLGTHLDNARDRDTRMRSGSAKLSPKQVREIRSSKETNVALAKKYGMGETAIWKIKHGVSWKHV